LSYPGRIPHGCAETGRIVARRRGARAA